jgi:hypothetical protein
MHYRLVLCVTLCVVAQTRQGSGVQLLEQSGSGDEVPQHGQDTPSVYIQDLAQRARPPQTCRIVQHD